MSKFLFITSSTLAANPRFVKVFESFKDKHDCSVVFFEQDDWGKPISEKIKNRNKNLTLYPIPYHKTIGVKLKAKLLHKVAILWNGFFQQSSWIAAHANSDKTYQLRKKINSIFASNTFNGVFVHTMGAFYPTLVYVPDSADLIVDIEDYHPGEVAYFNAKNEMRNRKLLMHTILQKAKYVTYASPLIMQESLKEFNQINRLQKKSILINNCFSSNEFQYKNESSERVKFVWFSQNIAKGRGLEEVIQALAHFPNQVELHLIGNLSKDFYQQYLQQTTLSIHVHEPKPQQELNLSLAHYDIGLCLEQGHCLNNELALSNKIWAYFQSGLYILATDTAAQKDFIAQHPKSGKFFQKDSGSMKSAVKFMLNNIQKIRKDKDARFATAQGFTWEIESLKLKQLIRVC